MAGGGAEYRVEPRQNMDIGGVRNWPLPHPQCAEDPVGDRILNHRACALAVASVAALGNAAAADPTGSIVGTVSITDADGSPADAEAIVYVVGFNEPARSGHVATIAQKSRTFVPDLIAVTAGERVRFPNADAFLHNVFSQSAARRFDLGSFKKGEAKAKVFPSPGVIDVYCNIHPEMAATILVVPNRRHSRRNPDGTYAIEGVPEGTWTIVAYVRRAARPAAATVTVVPGANVTVDFALVRGAEAPHLNKYGEPYRTDSSVVYR